jgi:HD-GYP domain-containing protein (c-di-GMP phosphodiesterase class II)
MFQAPDYSILDHLSARCAVVDFDFRYVYVNKAAARHEHMSTEQMLGHKVPEMRSRGELNAIFPYLKRCLDERKPVEYEDQLSHWKIKIEPIPQGAFIQWIRSASPKTRVKIRSNNAMTPLNVQTGYPKFASETSPETTAKVLELEGWLDSLDARTRETNGHILRVAEATVILARMLGLPEQDILCIRHGALLHDIGKIGVPDAILLKSDALTQEEWKIVRRHPSYAYDLLYPVEYFRNCLDIPCSHHEKWDGTGYPQGLKGEQIPLAARLFAVIEVWDALSTNQPYRKAWPREKIMEYMKGQSGSHFDPAVVDLFFRAKKDLVRLVT